MRTNRTLLLLPAFLVLLALVLTGCKDFSFYGVLGDRIDDTPLQIAPPVASVAEVSGLLSFSATGGMPPYSYSVIPIDGTGTINATTGAFSNGTVGDVTVRVTDSKGRTSNATITITPTGAILAISPVNISLSLGGGLTFVASGGTPPYSFSLTSSGSGSPTINIPSNGDYVAGLTPGVDTIQVVDGASDFAIATVNVSAATPTVDYSLTGFSISSPVQGGSLVSSASFHVQNVGIADGVDDIYYWVYLSDDGTLASGDTLLDAGSRPALPMGPGTDIGINGTWPLSSGAKSLFIMISAADDLNSGNNASAAVPVTLRLPDYQGTLTHDTGTTAGAGFTGTLTIDNAGTADGSQDVSWSVYASLGDTTIDTDDKIVASGQVSGGIGVLAAPEVIPIANTWPLAAGSYFLVAVIAAADEIEATGNQPSDGPVAVAAAPAPAVDYSGTISTGTPTRAGGGFNATLTINNGPVGGSSTVYWSVYASPGDTIINVGDKLVGSGSLAALGASGTSGPLAISSNWPAATGDYYLLARILADDETAPANNLPVSAVMAVGATDYSGVVAHSAGTTAGAAFTGTLTISNVGGPYVLAGSQNLYWNVYASLDLAIGADDKVVGSGMIASGLGAGANSGPLAIGNTWPSTAGTYYLIADLFAGDDANTANNRPVTGGIAVAAPPAANVNYGGAVAHSTGTTAGAGFTGSVTITNGGTTGGTQDVSWYVYASKSNATLGTGDALVASGTIVGGLPASGTSGALPIAANWPAATGTYYLVADIQAFDDVNLTNNQPASGAVAVTAPAADYSGTISTGAPTRAGGGFNATLTINNGPVGGSSTVYWSVYASPGDTIINVGDKLVGSGSLAALGASGTSGPLTISSSWPAATGDYYLLAQILADDETAPANNLPVSAVMAVGATDYSGAVAHTGGSLAGAAFTGNMNLSNMGGPYALAGSQDLYWNVYASLGDMVIGADDKVVYSGVLAGGLGAGVSTGLMLFGNTWPSTAGTYYLIAELYAGDDAVLANNQVISGAVAVSMANVNYGGVVANTGGTTAGGGLNGTITVTNAGSNNGTQDVDWYVYASLGNATIEAGDKLVASGTISGGLPGSGGSTGPVAFANTWPSAAGPYFLVADIQASDDVNLANNQPNSGAIPVTAPAVDYFGSLSSTPSLRAGGSFNATITILNGPAADGSSLVYWSVYASLGNTTIDAGDKVVATGVSAALPASGSFGPYLFSNTWPSVTGDYYLVADIQAADDINTANNHLSSVVMAVGATDYSGAVAHLSGTTAGAGFTFSLDINNIAGPYALAGSQDLYWNVYASLGNTTISVDDKVVANGFTAGGLAAGGNYNSGVLANTWPSAPGLYYLIADIFAGDDANTANNRPNVSLPVIAPLPPDYAVSFSTPPPWSAIVNTAIGGQFRIQNLSPNNGLQPINYSIYRSADKVLGGDVLLVSGSQPALGGGTFVDIPVADGDLWPATGQFCFLIAVISAADDSTMSNNTLAGHPTAVANVRYVEGVEDNDDAGPTPPAFSNVSITGQTLALNGTLAIEGTMDPYQGANSTYDTYRFATGVGVGGISMKARWDTGFDEIDLYLWNASGGEVTSIDTDLDSEPAGVPNLSVIGITASTNYFAGANFWLANNTSGSAGRPYVMLLTGNPP